MTRVHVQIRIQYRPDRVRKAAHQARITGIRHGAAAIRQLARRAIRRGKRASRPGQPPHTRRGRLKQSILFEATDRSAIIGPAAQFVGAAGSAHEFGGRYRGRQYDRRPFMAPALESLRPRLPKFWAATLK